MNRFIFHVALFVCGLSCVQADAVGSGIPGFFRDWLEKQKTLGDVRVEFGITKTLPTLKSPVKSSGRFWNYADGRFLWETGNPPASILKYDGLTLENWESSERKWRKLNPNDRGMRLWMSFLSGKSLSEESLAKEFIITVPEAKNSAASVVLEPRSARHRKDLKQIQLKFNTSEQRLIQLIVWQGDDGTQLMDFEKPQKMTAKDRDVVPLPSGN